MAIKYVPYYPDPVEGQAILDNFKRMLKYKGAGDDDSVAKQHVLKTIKETQMGWINPKGHESTGGYERPTRQQELEREVSRYNTSEAEATEQRAREVREAANRNRTQTNQNGNGGNSPTMDSIDPPNVN